MAVKSIYENHLPIISDENPALTTLGQYSTIVIIKRRIMIGVD